MLIVEIIHEPSGKPSARCNYPIPKAAATFDEVNLVPAAGLVPVMRLARLSGAAGVLAGEK